MFLSFGSLMVVAASWPTMPMRVCESCLDTYVAVATAAGQPVDFVVSGNLPDLGKLQIDALVAKAQCKAIINGSNVVFLAGGLGVENASVLQIGEPSISAVKTSQTENSAVKTRQSENPAVKTGQSEEQSEDDGSVAQPAQSSEYSSFVRSCGNVCPLESSAAQPEPN